MRLTFSFKIFLMYRLDISRMKAKKAETCPRIKNRKTNLRWLKFSLACISPPLSTFLLTSFFSFNFLRSIGTFSQALKKFHLFAFCVLDLCKTGWEFPKLLMQIVRFFVTLGLKLYRLFSTF